MSHTSDAQMLMVYLVQKFCSFLIASGFIAGEALVGLITSGFTLLDVPMPVIFKEPTYFAGVAVMLVLALILVKIPHSNAGSPDEPAPPVAMM